jgi:hypothetical protein
MLSENMGGWIGGQADYVMVPYTDFNLLKFPDKAQATSIQRTLDETLHCVARAFQVRAHASALQAGCEQPASDRQARRRRRRDSLGRLRENYRMARTSCGSLNCFGPVKDFIRSFRYPCAESLA